MTILHTTEYQDLFTSMGEDRFSVAALERVLVEKIGIRDIGSKMRQHPWEFATFLVWLAGHKDIITSYLEIGVFKGGSLFTVDAFMRSFRGEDFQSVGFDPKPRIWSGNLGYFTKNQRCHVITGTRVDVARLFPGTIFDLTFVDGDHRAAEVLKDYEELKGISRRMAFHDIVWSGNGSMVPEAWAKIKMEGSLEIVAPRGEVYGIGIL